MLLRRFSLFPSCKEGIKAGDMTFGELTNYMARHVYLEEMTQKARACLQADDLTGYERIKRSEVYAVTPNAYFKAGRKNGDLHTYSTGVMMFDWDHIEGDLGALVGRIVTHPSICLVSKSLSGSGVHAFARVEGITDDNFKSVYAAIGSQLEAIAGYPFDRQCNNFSRLMVLAHDPDLRVRDDAEPFQAEALLSGGSSAAMTSLAASDEVARYVVVAEANLNLSEGNRHSALVSLASCMNRKGFPEEKVIPVLVGRYAQAGFGEREIVSTIQDVYRRYAVDFGVNRKNPEKKEDAKVQKVQKVQKVHSAPDAETYMQAVACERPLVESFREQLPRLLQDAIDESQSADVQWAMLLAGLSVYSAMPIDVHFMEEDECYLPISCIWVGESTSGKGRIKVAADIHRLFAKAVARDFEANEIIPARSRLKEWEARQEAIRKLKEEVEGGWEERPLVPENKFLQTSMSTSESQFVRRLLINQPYTTLRFTEEIGTVCENTKREYGVSRSNLRAGLEGGRMSLDYKDGGFICVDNARMVDLYAGTPGAFQQFIDNQEDGLSHRFLYAVLDYNPAYKRLRMGKRMDRAFWDAMEGRIRTFKVNCENQHMDILFSAPVMDLIEDLLEDLCNRYACYANPSFLSYIRRMRKKAMQLCALLTFMQACEENLPYAGYTEERPRQVDCPLSVARLVVSWIPYLVYTAACMIAPLRKNETAEVKLDDLKTEQLFESLPDDFSAEDFEQAASRLQISRSTAMRRRKIWLENGVLIRVSHGKYQKRNVSTSKSLSGVG